MAELQNVPEGGELWRVGKSWYVVYLVPGSDPAVPMAWKVNDIAGITEPGSKPAADRTFSSKQAAAAEGVLEMGVDAQLADFTDDPFETFVQDYERQAQALPFLQDPEVMALYAGALLEGRTPTSGELTQTDYWQSRTEAERDWLTLTTQDPEEARHRLAANRRAIQAQLREAGVSDAPDALIDLLNSRWTSGQWGESFIQNQIRGLADPYSDAELAQPVIEAARGFDPTSGDLTAVGSGEEGIRARLQAIFDNRDLDPNAHLDGSVEEGRLDRLVQEVRDGNLTIDRVRQVADRTAGTHTLTGRDITRAGEDEVRKLLNDWLGPNIAQQYSDEWVRQWAGRMRNDPDAQAELNEELRTLRLAAFPEWDNENLRYVDVAPTAKSLFQQVWGRDPGESDPLFTDILRMTGPGGDGVHAATTRLRREGRERGEAAVWQDAASGILQATGGSVRQGI